ncbi:MAG: hypothetical protein QOJ00_2365 [Actinomycetota bacterium]
MHDHDERPWGSYTVLDDAATHKIKRIDVGPGKRLSYQRHAHRSEHWFVVAGTAEVTLDGDIRRLGPGDAIDIPLGAAHRVANPGREPLVFVEIQTGTYAVRTTSNASKTTSAVPNLRARNRGAPVLSRTRSLPAERGRGRRAW